MKNKGITLVALIITIIVLLILATVSISLVINNGVLDKAQHGVDKYSEEEEFERVKLAVASAMLKGNGFLDTENLNAELQDRFQKGAEQIGNSKRWSLKLDKNYTIYENGNVEENKSLLPAEYQQVEYIESTGTQYIDTKFKPTTDTKVKCVLASEKMGTTHNIAYYGARTSYQANTNFGFLNYKERNKLRFDRGNFSSSGYSDLVEAGTFYEIVQNKNENYVDGLKVSESNGDFVNVNYNIFIFGINENGNYLCWDQDKISFKIFQIYNNGERVRDFIPCYSTTTVTNVKGVQVPENTKGLYDLVEGKFYTNKNTSGNDFIAGPNV